jgi:uncharacterized membrane protein YhhN
MIFPVIFVLAAALLLVLLVYEKQEKEKPRLIAKTILSCLFVLVAFLQPSSVPFYGKFILLGLISCLAGDVCLALPGDKIFRAGLVAFLYVAPAPFESHADPRGGLHHGDHGDDFGSLGRFR